LSILPGAFVRRGTRKTRRLGFLVAENQNISTLNFFAKNWLHLFESVVWSRELLTLSGIFVSRETQKMQRLEFLVAENQNIPTLNFFQAANFLAWRASLH